MSPATEKSLEIRVFATLRTLCKPISTHSFQTSASISDILEVLGIPADKVAIIFINGRHAELDSIPSDGDKIGIFPPVGGG